MQTRAAQRERAKAVTLCREIPERAGAPTTPPAEFQRSAGASHLAWLECGDQKSLPPVGSDQTMKVDGYK